MMPSCQDLGMIDIDGPLHAMEAEPLNCISGWIFDAPWLREFVKTLPLGEGHRIALIRILRPEQSIPPHVDRDIKDGVPQRRYQLPLVTHPDVVMSWITPEGTREPYHLQVGHLYEVDYRKIHEVENHSSIDRVHIQIDVLEDTSSHAPTH